MAKDKSKPVQERKERTSAEVVDPVTRRPLGDRAQQEMRVEGWR